MIDKDNDFQFVSGIIVTLIIGLFVLTLAKCVMGV